jgi:rSAM/selenodomain-associated transferase 1
MRQRILLFTRFPEPGTTKTRLIPLLGPDGAAALQRAMTERALRRLAGAAPELEVRYAGGGRARMAAWLGEGVRLAEQGEGDLGARLRRAFSAGFAEGLDAVVAVGADCPDLGRGEADAACGALAACDAVFGPAADGGYYLVGVRRTAWAAAEAALFTGIPWGEAGVLAASLEAARGAGLAVRLLRTLADVDRPEDLRAWERRAP